MNKYQAADEFSRGAKKALFGETPDLFDWDNTSKLFMAGYQWGRSIKNSYLGRLNESLAEIGHEPMTVISLCESNESESAKPDPLSLDEKANIFRIARNFQHNPQKVLRMIREAVGSEKFQDAICWLESVAK